MSEPFRTASTGPVVQAAPISGPTVKSDVNIAKSDHTPGLFSYKTVKGKPYTVEAFKLSDFYDHPDYKTMREQVEAVDEWVQQQAKRRGLEDKPESYQEIVDEILKQIGKSENEKPHRTFERVTKAVEAQKRLAEAKLPQVLDVNSMTADEYIETRAD